jgi:hypothetical protein
MAKLAVYSPIPGTEEWKKAIEEFDLDPNADPLLHNNSIYPIRPGGMTIQDYQKIKDYALSCNNALA